MLERRGLAIRFNPLLLDFAKHYRFEPRPVAVARGNEKGRVERAIRYIRGSFFAARRFRDLDDLNRQAETWCDTAALDRQWPEGHTRTVREAWLEEGPTLLAPNANPFPDDERREVHVGKTPYVRFDGNDYGFHTQRLLRLLDLYGREALEHAIAEELAHGAPHLHAIRQILERERYTRGEAPPLAVQLPDQPKLYVSVRTHSLETYDAIGGKAHTEPEPPRDRDDRDQEHDEERHHVGNQDDQAGGSQ